MKKFTESMEDSGTRDIDGTWIPETPQAKLRNRLSPFWNLSEILSNDDMLSKMLSTEKGREIIKSLSDRCNENKSVILDLIKQTEKE
jgi:hypothetical protein